MFKNLYLLKLTLIVSLGGFLFGYDTSVISGAISSITKYFNLTGWETGWAVSNVVVGCVIGSLIAIKVSNFFGRKKTLIFASILLLISALGSGYAPDFTQFVIYRMIGGIGVGLVAVTSPMYIAEISPNDSRARLSMLNDFAIVVGQIIVFFVNFYIAKGMAESWLVETGWRNMLLSELIPAGLFFLFLFSISESPRWLTMKNKEQEALNIVSKYENPLVALDLVNNWSKSIQSSKSKLPLLILVIACALASFQQLSGVNVMMYYAPMVLEKIVGSYEEALFQTIWIGVAQAIGVFIGGFLLDKYGRVPMMKIGALGSAAGLLYVSYAIYFNQTGYSTLVGMIIFMLFYAISFGLGMWVLIAELFPNLSRSTGLSLAVTFNWMFNFLVAQTFPMMAENETLKELFNGAFPMWLYAGCMILGFLFVSKYLPETKGKSLEQIEKELSHG